MSLDLKKIRETPDIELLARQLVEGFITGLHKSPYHGFSVEFAEHRLYNTGESTRYVDWKVFARTDRLFSKRFEEETNLRCYIVIDNSSSMYYPIDSQGKISFSITMAACLAYLLQKQRDAVGMITFSNNIELQTEIKSTPSHLHKLFLFLNQLLKNPPKHKVAATDAVLHQIAEKIHKRSLVIIFTDMLSRTEDLEETFKAIQHLKYRNHEVLLVHVREDLTEVDFEFENRPYEFYDLETNEKLKVQPETVRNTYTEQMQQQLKLIKERCGQLKIDWVEADINKDVNKVLMSYLIKRNKMR